MLCIPRETALKTCLRLKLSNRHLFLKENRLLVVEYFNINKICRLTGGTTQLED